jgi:hypothetical protein
MTYLDVLTKHGYTDTNSTGFYRKSKNHIAEIYHFDINRIHLYAPAGGYTLSGRTLYSTGEIKPTPEQLDVIITVLTAE